MTGGPDAIGAGAADDIALRFDPAWFRATYPAAADQAAGTDGALLFGLYLEQARSVAASPNPHFDEKFYRATYADVDRSVENGTFWSGYHHYLRHGHAEFRRPRKPTSRVAIDLRSFATVGSDPFRDVHVRLLVRGLVRLMPTTDFLLVVGRTGIGPFAEVEGAGARRLPMTDNVADMIRVLRKRAIDYLLCPYASPDLSFPAYASIACAFDPVEAARPGHERAAMLGDWRHFDGFLCADDAIRRDVQDAVGADGTAVRRHPLDRFVRDGLRSYRDREGNSGARIVAVAGTVDGPAADQLVDSFGGGPEPRHFVLIDADEQAVEALTERAAARGAHCTVSSARSAFMEELGPVLTGAEAIVDAGCAWKRSLLALARAAGVPVVGSGTAPPARAKGWPAPGRADGAALLGEFARARDAAKARTVLHGLSGRTGEIEWLGLRVAPSPCPRTLCMTIRFPHDVPDRRLRLEQWFAGELRDRIVAEPGETKRIEVPLPVDGGNFDWRLVAMGEREKWHLVSGGAESGLDRRMRCLHAFVRQEQDLVLAAPGGDRGHLASTDAALGRVNALIQAYEPLKQELIDELFRITAERPALQLTAPRFLFASGVSAPRVLHVVKPSVLDPALLYHGSTKDILGRREYFADRGFVVDELVVPPKEEREGQAIRALMARRGVEYDIIFIEYLLYPELMRYLRDRYPRAKVLVRGHNAEVLHRLDTIKALWATNRELGWRERFRAVRLRKQLRTVRRYLLDEVHCARLADAVVSISDWESRHYWPLVVGSRRTVTVPYFVPSELHRSYAPGVRQRRIVALSSVGPGPLVQHALDNFKRVVAASATQLADWTFAATGEFDAGDVIRHRRINFVGTVGDPIEELRGAAAMALLSPLGYGFKTKIMDAVTAGAFTLLPASLLRRVPEELRAYCIAVDPEDARSFIDGANRALTGWPEGDPNRALRDRAYRAMDSIVGITLK